MELVILSTVAAVAILIAELRDLAGREHFARPAAAAAVTRLTASVIDLDVRSRVAHEEWAAPPSDLDRAA